MTQANPGNAQTQLDAHARPGAAEDAALAWFIETWDDEEIVYGGEWEDLLRSGK